jgi:hypothetical protein
MVCTKNCSFISNYDIFKRGEDLRLCMIDKFNKMNLGNSPTSEFYMPTFRNTLSHLHRRVGVCRMN